MDTVDLDVENLFNDGNLDQILPTNDALQPSALVPGLAEHFLNLQFCGGINRASWSRQGHIAVISSNGTEVNVHCLRSHPETREWGFGTPRTIDTTFDHAVNVTWSPSGVDLAVINNQGQVAIYSMTTTCLNRLNESKSMATDTPDELGMPIGTWWLNQDRQDRPRNVVSGAYRDGERWSHVMTKAKALGPLYPRAFCMVDRRGVFTLTYQRPGARYTKASVALPSLSDTVCSHAAFSPTIEGKVMVAVHSVKGDLSVFLIQINWPSDLMSDPNSSSNPDLGVEVINDCVSVWAEFDATNSSLVQGYKPDDSVLTCLTIIPRSDVENAEDTPPTIWAVYTSISPAVSANDAGFVSTSIIRRWSVYPYANALHPRFDDMPGKAEATGSDQTGFEVERLSDLIFPQAITSMELVDSGQMVAISAADGRTELWNPVTQTLVSYEAVPDEVTSMAQFGFSFNPAVNAVTTVLSPNACSTLTLAEDLKPTLHYVQYPIQSAAPDLDLSDPHQSASVAGIVLTFARSCWSNTNGDDLLSCVLANYTSHQFPAILSELYRTLFRDTEFIHEKAPDNEVERLASKPIVLKALSFQLGLQNSHSISLTSPNEDVRYSALSGIWSWLVINLRCIATTFYIFYREYQASIQSNANQRAPQPLSPSYVDTVCSTVHWVLDLWRFIVATILEIGDRQTNPDFFSPPTFNNNYGDAVGDGSQGLVALLLNCQWSRTFLSAISRGMRAFIESNERGPHPAISRVVSTIRQYSVDKGMNIGTIDRILDGRWYTRNGLREGEGMDAATVAKRQIAMCCTGKVGPEFSGTLKMLLDKVFDDPEHGLRAKGEIQRLKLWRQIPDMNWLLLGFHQQFSPDTGHGLTSDAHGNETLGRKLYDVHRKSTIPLTGKSGQMVRRCVRCGSLSGDIDGVDKSWSKHMMTYMARCVCDAYWLLEPVSEVDGK